MCVSNATSEGGAEKKAEGEASLQPILSEPQAGLRHIFFRAGLRKCRAYTIIVHRCSAKIRHCYFVVVTVVVFKIRNVLNM